MTSGVFWAAVSSLVAVCALVVSVVAWLSQRSRDRQQVQIQKRLAAIEEARREEEIDSRDKAREASLAADVRVYEIRMESLGGTRQPDHIIITIENRGAAIARNIDIAIKDSEDMGPGAGLGKAIESIEGEFGGYGGNSPKHYFEIPWNLGTPRPLEMLGPGDRVTFPFLFYR